MIFYSLASAFLFASSHVESLKVILDPEDSSYDRAVDTYFKAVGIESEDDEFFSQFGGLLERSQKGLLASRKMKQLKSAIVGVMADSIKQLNTTTGSGFGRYCGYGCWCLAVHEHIIMDAVAPGGNPVDDIDRACRQHHVCTTCLSDKHKTQKSTCLPEDNIYKLIIDTEAKELDCSLNKNSCRRDICECDKRLAMDLKTHEHEWNVNYHTGRAGFDRAESCPHHPGGGNQGGSGGGKPRPPPTGDKCCGKAPDFHMKTKSEPFCCRGLPTANQEC
ncbi:unnamed protein product [Oikopleura dioica]|uniref:Phospholipase A2-like central domain-containing protein n=1 Tax=Oikopleura dioica TaxID=34765 RepID=E4YMB0_OIKDI|nr:unnamed protein product [Oikopleura dioica]